MPNFTDLTGLMGVASAVAAPLLLLPPIKRLTGTPRLWVMCAAFLLVLVPMKALPIAAYVRGATGDLSITAVVLLWLALLRPWLGSGASDSTNRRALLSLIAIAALVFYPMALGFGAFDPYRMGYANGWFVAVLLLIAVAAWILRHHLPALCISLAVLAWAFGWYESSNLWDYLLDPFVSIYALSALLIRAAKYLKKPQE